MVKHRLDRQRWCEVSLGNVLASLSNKKYNYTFLIKWIQGKKKYKHPQFKQTWHSSLIFKWHTSLIRSLFTQLQYKIPHLLKKYYIWNVIWTYSRQVLWNAPKGTPEMVLQPTVYWLICFYYLILLDLFSFFYFRFVFLLSSVLSFITYVSKIWFGHILDWICDINQNIPDMALLTYLFECHFIIYCIIIL